MVSFFWPVWHKSSNKTVLCVLLISAGTGEIRDMFQGIELSRYEFRLFSTRQRCWDALVNVTYRVWSTHRRATYDLARIMRFAGISEHSITELLQSHKCTKIFSRCFRDVVSSSYGTIFYTIEDLHLIYSRLHGSHVQWYVYSMWVAFFAGHESRELFKSYDGHIIMCPTDSFKIQYEPFY